MAIPNTNTFTMSDVYNELHWSGYTVTEFQPEPPSPSLSNFFSQASEVSFDSLYSGNTNKLSNFRNFNLITGFTVNTSLVFDMAADNFGNIWMPYYGGTYITVMAEDGTTTISGSTGAGPYAIAYDGTNMWTANRNGNSVTKITPSNVSTTYSSTGSQPSGIAFDGTNMWTVNSGDDSVSKITPAGVITTYTGLVGNSARIASDGTNVWVVDAGAVGAITKVTPTGTMTRYDFAAGTNRYPQGVAFDGINMWVVSEGADGIIKVSPTGIMTYYDNRGGDSSYLIDYDGTYMWTPSFGGGNGNRITAFDSLGASKVITLGSLINAGWSVAFSGKYIWAADRNNHVVRIGAGQYV
jgi:hypothetical protein